MAGGGASLEGGQAALHAIRRIVVARQKAARSALLGVGYDMATEAARVTPVDKGRLKRGWTAKLIDDSLSHPVVEVGNPVEYASPVEFGTPHMPPRPMIRHAANVVGQRLGRDLSDGIRGGGHHTSGGAA